ncbi:MAG TPA: hypothetical protein VF778_13120 [Xanthobacteraceae bacterium]
MVAGEFTLNFPTRHNIRYLATPNINNDYGGYCSAINALGDEISAYDFFYFINSSVRGPFLPPYIRDNWKDIFRAKLTDDVGLVGSTINILAPGFGFSLSYKQRHGGNEPFSHVQTMAYAMPRRTLAYLRDAGFYSNVAALDKWEVIADYEIRMSQLILRNGWNITAFLPEYGTLDYRKHQPRINPISTKISGGDMNFPYCYFGRSAHPFEVVFVKTNRGIFSEEYLDRLAYSALFAQEALPDWTDCAFVTEYLARVKAIAHSEEGVALTASEIAPEMILSLNETMLRQYPETRDQLEALLKRSRQE